MVYVNSKKFACESCIKGHRSSSCHHTDRPLFEIKKKGRPVSQCERCRELRQSKRVHSKCTCNATDDTTACGGTLKAPSGTKSRRFIPIVPALPNGLKDVMQTSRISKSTPADLRQRVDSLLNPCNCKSVWKCKCRSSPDDLGSQISPKGTSANAATVCCNGTSTSAGPTTTGKPTKRKSSRPGSPSNLPHKRTKHGTKTGPSFSPGPTLAPIYLEASSASTSNITTPIPTFPTMPSMSEISSLAGSGCTCGLKCACPGCVEHRGAKHASTERRDCADGCGTCVDNNAGIGLPGHGFSAVDSSNSPNFLDKFFARAAALPAPPANRRMPGGVELDPMNIMVYPDTARTMGEHGVAFGLVSLPKLECCGGKCSCPEAWCGCGKSCDGCCTDHGDGGMGGRRKSEERLPVSSEPTPSATPVSNCCIGKTVVTT